MTQGRSSTLRGVCGAGFGRAARAASLLWLGAAVAAPTLPACRDNPTATSGAATSGTKRVPVDPATLSPGAPGAADPVVATFGDQEVHASELRERLVRTKHEYRRVPAHEAPSWEALKKALLDKLLEHRMWLAEAKRRNLSVEPAELERALDLSRAGYGGDHFEEMLLETGQTLTQFRAALGEKLLIEALMREVFKQVQVTGADARARFDQQPQKYALPERVRALHIAVRTEPEARRLRKKLVDNEAKFEDLARRFSESPEGKTKGGDLGFFSKGQKPKVFEETCFRLEVGKISQVTPSEYAYHLFKVVEKQPARARTFDEAKADVLAELKRERERATEDAFRQDLLTRMPIKIDAAVLKKIR